MNDPIHEIAVILSNIFIVYEKIIILKYIPIIPTTFHNIKFSSTLRTGPERSTWVDLSKVDKKTSMLRKSEKERSEKLKIEIKRK